MSAPNDMESRLKNKCPRYFMCVICYDVMQLASALPCGHEFCDNCIRKAFRIKRNCPLCVAVFRRENITPSYEKRKRIEQLIIGCKNSPLGCEHFTNIKKIEMHEYLCDFDPEVKLRKEIEDLEARLKDKKSELSNYKPANKRKAADPSSDDSDD
jgi:hypothetical protein